MHTKKTTLILEVPNPNGTGKSLKSHKRLSYLLTFLKQKGFCLEIELVCASGKGGKPHEFKKGCHFIKWGRTPAPITDKCTHWALWTALSMKHSRGWRPGSGSLPPPSKGQKLSVNIAACSNLLLINPINNPKVLRHKIHTKDTILQYAIYGRMRKDNSFICNIFHVFVMPQKAILGAISFILRRWGKPSQRSSIWNIFNSFSQFLLMPNLWEARRTYVMWPDSLLYSITKALWAIVGSSRPEFENWHFLIRFSNHCFV